MSDMAIEGEQYMDTDLEEEISISTESYMLLRHQDPSSSSEDCKEDEEKGSDSGMCQTRSKRNVHAVLPFTGPSPGVPVSNIVRNPPPPNCLSFFFLSDFLKSTFTVISIMLQKVITQYLRKKCSTFLL
jgi:hypothetical protein